MTQIINPLIGISNGSDGEVVFDTGVNLGTAVDAPLITANTNNLVIPNLETAIVIRLSSTGNFTLTGIVPFNASKAWMQFFVNIGTNNIQLSDNSASSTASNRFLMGASKTLQQNEGVLFFYDPISQRWRSAGINI